MPLSPQEYRKTAFTHRRGTRANQPNFADVLAGTLYYVTDELKLERSTGAAWETYSGGAVGTFTAASIIFAGATGLLTDDNSGLQYDSTNKIVSIAGSTASLRLRAVMASGRFYAITINDGSGALELSMSTGLAKLRIAFDTSTKQVRFTSDETDPILNFVALGGTLVFCPGEGGGDKKAQFGRRVSDDSTGVGVQAEFWPRSTATVPTIAQMAPGGATYQWRIENNGDMQFVVTSSKIYWASRSRISSPADGQLLLRDSAETSFSLLQFGGTTSSFPALKRSSALIQARLADDSLFAQFSALEFINNRANFLMRTAVSWTDGAAGNTGTLGTAPTAGDPTKWIPVDDNGVTRYIPAW